MRVFDWSERRELITRFAVVANDAVQFALGSCPKRAT